MIELIKTIIYPFGYFFLLGIVYAVSKFITLFCVASGRLKSFHAIENYWIYLLIGTLCVLVGVIVGHGNLLVFYRWFICSLLAGMIGIHFGFDKGVNVSDEELKELEDSLDEME